MDYWRSFDDKSVDSEIIVRPIPYKAYCHMMNCDNLFAEVAQAGAPCCTTRNYSLGHMAGTPQPVIPFSYEDLSSTITIYQDIRIPILFQQRIVLGLYPLIDIYRVDQCHKQHDVHLPIYSRYENLSY